MAVSTDDLAAFAALRSLVDEFPAAAEALKASIEPFPSPQCAEKPEKMRRKRRTKSQMASSPSSSSSGQSYNPNRARDDERREIGELRDQVNELSQELDALQQVKTSSRSCKMRTQDEKMRAHESVELPRDKLRAAQVWKEIANDQFQQHMRAVRENRRLKRVVEGHREITTGLKKLLEQRLASEVILWESFSSLLCVFELILCGFSLF